MSKMNIEEFVRTITTLFPQIVKGFARYEHNYLTRGEITLPQFWGMDYLYQEGKIKMSRLAQSLGTTRAAATGLIDRLIAQGLVLRKNDPYDRRIVWIQLTAKGKRIIHNIRRQKSRTLVKVFGKISPKDRESYLNILGQIAHIANSLPHAGYQKGVSL